MSCFQAVFIDVFIWCLHPHNKQAAYDDSQQTYFCGCSNLMLYQPLIEGNN